MLVRKGQITDLNAVLDLIIELAVFEKEPNAVIITIKDLQKDGFGLNPLFSFFVAEVDNQIIGMAFYYNRYSTWKGKTIHLEDLIVKEKFRSLGAGMALYTEIIKEAKKQNVNRVEWNVLDWNTPAIVFYEKTGAKFLKDWCNVQMDKKGIDAFLKN